VKKISESLMCCIAWRKKKSKKIWEENGYDRAAGILRIESREASNNKCTGK